MSQQKSNWWTVEYRSPRPSPKLKAKGGISIVTFRFHDQAQQFAQDLRNKNIEVLCVRQRKK